VKIFQVFVIFFFTLFYQNLFNFPFLSHISDEPPLLEELGIDFTVIQSKIMDVFHISSLFKTSSSFSLGNNSSNTNNNNNNEKEPQITYQTGF